MLHARDNIKHKFMLSSLGYELILILSLLFESIHTLCVLFYQNEPSSISSFIIIIATATFMRIELNPTPLPLVVALIVTSNHDIFASHIHYTIK